MDQEAIVKFGSALVPLTEPVVKLLDTISSAIGTLYEPRRIVNKAKAEAQAQIIQVKAEAEANLIRAENELELRMFNRIKLQEIRRQKNIENIVNKAITALPESVSSNPVDEDWVNYFFESCQDVGNEEMQSLWAKILAREVSAPASFESRTIGFVKMLNKSEAEIFTRFCTFIWTTQDNIPVPLVWDKESDFLKAKDIRYAHLLHLETIGLLSLNFTSCFQLTEQKGHELKYFDKRYYIEIAQEKRELDIGFAVLTHIGIELFSIAGGEKDEQYQAFVIRKWEEEGHKVIELP